MPESRERTLERAGVFQALRKVVGVARVRRFACKRRFQNGDIAGIRLRVAAARAFVEHFDPGPGEGNEAMRDIGRDVFVQHAFVAKRNAIGEKDRQAVVDPRIAMRDEVAVGIERVEGKIVRDVQDVIGIHDEDVVRAAAGERQSLAAIPPEVAPRALVKLPRHVAHVLSHDRLRTVGRACVHHDPVIDVRPYGIEAPANDVRLVLHDHVEAYRDFRHRAYRIHFSRILA